jgi:hypothetical protein
MAVVGNDPYGPYQPPYQMPPSGTAGSYGLESPAGVSGVGAGTGPGGSTPYIGGTGDPNYAGLANGGNGLPERPSSNPSNYGPYLGWDQGKLNDPTHNTPKYQFLRAMLDAGINSQNRDLTGAVSALKARGYPVEAVPGSSDRITWGDQGTYDIFNGTNGDFLFGDVNAAPGAPMGAGTPAGPAETQAPYYGGATTTGLPMQAPDLQPTTASSYVNPNQANIAGQWKTQPYRPPYYDAGMV